MKKNILSYIDFERFNTLLEGFHQATGFVTAILDLEGNVISKSGWRHICTNFHRANPETLKHCIESDTVLSKTKTHDKSYYMYKCKNGLIDVVVPIKIKGELVLNLFTGQFLLEDPDIDWFKKQAKKYGFDETAYVNAITDVPIVSEERVEEILSFLHNLTQNIIDLTVEKMNKEKSEMLLKSSLESPIDFLILAIDKEFNYLYFNQSYKRYVKELYDADISIGMNLLDIFSYEADVLDVKSKYKQAFEGESFTIVENINSDNQNRFFEAAYNPIYGENKDVIGSTVFARDVTENVTMENELKESEQRFKILHNASFGGIAIHDKGLILDCNQGLSDITGYSIDELVGMNGLLLVAPDYRDFVMNKIQTGYEEPYEAYGMRKNKELFPLKLEARNLPYQDKEVRVVEFRDLTEIKEQEEARKKTEKRYQLLFETMNKGVVFHNSDGYITSCNTRASEILGLSLSELQGKTTMDPRWKMIDEQGHSISGDNHPAMIASRTKETVGPVVRAVYHPEQDKYVWLSITAIPLFVEGDKNPNQVYATFDDITEKREYEKEIQAVNNRLQLVMDNLPIGISVNSINPKVEFQYMNENFPKIYGVTKEKLEKENFWDLVYKDTEVRKKVKKQVMDDIKSGDVTRMSWENIPIINKDGTRYISAYNTPIPNTNLYISSVIDVTDRKIKEISIEYASNHDSLTGLPNRRFFQDQLQKLDSAFYYPLGIMMLDLNRLKLINDTYGHNYGDKALISVAKKLKDIMKKNDFVARLGGDEFAFICPNTSAEEIEHFANKIATEVDTIKINDIKLSMAVGYDMKNDTKVTIDKTLLQAENKMYKDKSIYHYKKHDDAISSILEALKSKYREEKIHSDRVSRYCKLIAKALNLKPSEITEVEIAGMYHDIGKISIPDKILGKPGKLNDEEWAIMKNHTINGYQILRSVHEYTNIAEYAMSHHERIDGLGYPNGLKGEDIPLFSRIICVADAYEAMTSDRVYKKAMKREQAISELKKHAGKQFDERIVDVFITKVLKK